MTHIFEQSGIPGGLAEMCKTIVDTCQPCRLWAKPLPESVASVNVPSEFNEYVECDLIFYKKHVIFHMIDRTIRWHAVQVIKIDGLSADQLSGEKGSYKDFDTLIDAINDMWIRVFGPMKYLVVDGESAISGWKTGDYLNRHGITMLARAQASMLDTLNVVVACSKMRCIRQMSS
jgi:hypothetical protein